ncbi:BZIP transcription factor [Penicillium ucsense]|uniref:BZIP transcription factor n=1 Tax=Penicillium ucsense TaxID=2839758 RepID=A0A8J8W973_9EURO|nr:BZIP transcription factor [Penicillium ucsense]KAF7737163.1 BZIP transcription factor [Penicillium ucsense]
MDQQLPVRLSSDLPLFNWDEFHESTFTSEPTYPLLHGSATSDINSLLSARSYPLAKSHNTQNAQNSTPSPSHGDLALELAAYSKSTNTNQTPLPKPQKRQRGGYKKAAPSGKNRGAPRDDGSRNESPDERRRMQTRLAQRAYRSRQQATVESLRNRISFLEASIEKMSSAMLSFSEQLVQSGVLRSQSAVTTSLRDTMKIFLSSASGASIDEGRMTLFDSNRATDLPPSPPQPTTKRLSLDVPFHLPLVDSGVYYPKGAVLPVAVKSPGTSIIDVTEFIERLLLAALYQGYLALSNPSFGMDQLQRPFGLIFTMMNRDRLTSYFKAELYAQVNRKPLDGWEEVPFFRLGRAGTHYPDGSAGAFVRCFQRWGTVEDPLSLVTADLRKQLEGDWFDLQDLEGYLRDKNVLLVVSAGEPTRRSEGQINTNVSRFISALIPRGVCLGRTPGFRRGDVEEALHVSNIV